MLQLDWSLSRILLVPTAKVSTPACAENQQGATWGRAGVIQGIAGSGPGPAAAPLLCQIGLTPMSCTCASVYSTKMLDSSVSTPGAGSLSTSVP